MEELEKRYLSEAAGMQTLDLSDDTVTSEWINIKSILAEIPYKDWPVQVKDDRVLPWAGTFSDKELKVAIELEHIMQYPRSDELINPADDLMNPASIDFRLGHYFYLTDQNPNKVGFYNHYDQEDVDRYFGEVQIAEPLREIGLVRHKLGLQAIKNIDPDRAVIILRPGERILAHSHDFMGIDAPGIGQIFATSTKARNGITIAQDSTFMNPGWKDRITLEIKNENEDEHIPLIVGDVVGQTVYHSAGPTASSYVNNGAYRASESSTQKQIIKNWRPERMKPKVKLPKPLPRLDGLADGLL